MKKNISFIIILLIIIVGYLFWDNVKKTKTVIPNSIEAPTKTLNQVVLREDGIGILNLGKTAEDALLILNPLLGQPTKDTGWVDSFSSYGNCPGEKIRGIEWGNLHLLFGDTIHGNKSFFGYEYVNRNGINKPILKTEKSITLGATKEEISSAYPNATFGDWLPGQIGTTFIRGAEESGEYLGGTIENDKLFWIGGGIFCGE